MAQKFLASLIAAGATGAGSAQAFPEGYRSHALQVILGGTLAPTTAVVNLEGTLDGQNWFSLAQWTKASQASGDIVFAVDKPVAQVRANLASLAGGTAPTVSANILSVP